MAQRTFKITIFGYGGEYSLGSVTDGESFEALQELAENSELSAWNDDVNGDEVNFYDYDDVLNLYGADYNQANLDIAEEGRESKTISASNSFNFSLSNPDLYGVDNEDNDVAGYFGGASIEKGTFGEVVIESDSDFDASCLVFGTVNLDETFNSSEIITKAYYIKDWTPIKDFVHKYMDDPTIADDELLYSLRESLEYAEDRGDSYNPLNEFEVEIDFDNIDTNGKSSIAVLFDQYGENLFYSE
jgi:hypothetical protein